MTEQRNADSSSAHSEQFTEPTEQVKIGSKHNSWTNRIIGVWNDATARLIQSLPVEQAAQMIVQWFSVDEKRVTEILKTIRAELPTTEALLIGKPQAGKSSIVRGLTGVSAEIVGQGFRPHTQHTERYAYPSNDLPLLIFTDTVGLGDVNQETETIIEELIGDLQQKSSRARILILTVKINDFATDTLRQIARKLRQQYPDIPCLLAVTCLHEVYPLDTADHPAYPPDYEEVNRAFSAIEQAFADSCDRTVALDFTLEEDGYTPVFYGLEALRDTLADLLPEAEARAIHQLLDNEAGDQIGNLYRDVGRHYISAFAVMAATLAAVPLPFATMPVLTALQVSMVGLLGKLYGQTLSPSQAGGVVSAIAGGFLAQAVGRELIKFLPGFGSVIAASWAAAYTWALGEGACVYFGDLMGGKKPDPKKIQSVMQEAFESAKERFKGIKR
ncbi:50S ribosome-binding GTPase [Pleurocapsales cyanobacterium LEGE 06147]|nr:50S ribosome-binding GTPase [Pleurocapsales cyanobacterium LEGE 06147]